jgi:ubiquinone/menaquinone biosynthesis C-methylase UbiE
MKDAKKKFYDDRYDGKISIESPHGVIAFLYRNLLRFEVTRHQISYNLLPLNGERLLDVGCGNGYFMFMAKDKFKECYGVDISSVRIQQAKKRSKERPNGDSFHFYEYDIDKGLPFSNSFFDAVSCLAVLEHVFNPPKVLEEIHRVLKPGGTLIVHVPNIAWIPYRIQLLFGKLPKTGIVYLGADWDHLHNFTRSTLSTLLMEKGFEIKIVTCSGIFQKHRMWWLSTLSADIIIKSVKHPHFKNIVS